MSSYKCDVGIRVMASSPEEAAQLIAAVLAAGQSAMGDAFRPAFIGIRPAETSEPEPGPDDQAQADPAEIFGRIMAAE